MQSRRLRILEKKHSNISFSVYKDYQNLSLNNFDEEKQKIWDLAVRKFHVTHQRITDKELGEFYKIYISHFAGKETKDKERGDHFYTTYQIVSPCSNIDWDRSHTLYIDKENKIVILERQTNQYGNLNEITEEILKNAESKNVKFTQKTMKELGIDDEFIDKLANRTDKWLQKYDEWLSIS
jgi:hypothetical protein